MPLAKERDKKTCASFNFSLSLSLSLCPSQPNFAFDFEQFVDCFDEDDQFIKRVFQFLVKETAQRHRTAHPQTQQSLRRPYTIHHSPAHTRVVRSVGPAPASYSPADSPRMRRPYSATVFRHIYDPAEMEREQEEEDEDEALQHDLSEDEEADLDLQLDAAAAVSSALASMSSVADLIPGGSLTSYYSSGAALRSMLDARGTGPYSRSRRSRMAHRMLSYDLLTLDQNRGHLESLLSPSPFGSTAPSSTGSGSASGTRRPPGVVLRRPSARSLLDSMESAPESFTRPGSAPLPSSGSTFYGIQSQEPLHLPGHEWRQQMIRSVYAQHLQERERARARTLQTLNGQTTTAEANGATPATTTVQDTPGHQQQQLLQPSQSTPAASATPQSLQADQQQDRTIFAPHENALLLVEPSAAMGTSIGNNPTSANSESSPPSTAQSSTAIAARPSLSSYEEFQNLTRRGREVLRNEYANELYIEEDAQVLATGEVSRRRRRRGGQILNPNNGHGDTAAHAYDIAANNSSTIISQSQQQAPGSLPQENSVSTSAAATAAVATITATTDREENPVGGTHQEAQPSEATTGLGIPTITVQGAEGSEPGVGAGSNSQDDSSSNNSEPRRRVGLPPTPPSPNPNRNPMPTFADRRRSSINPADIEAFARQMEQQQ